MSVLLSLAIVAINLFVLHRRMRRRQERSLVLRRLRGYCI
jgi:hypothetical protein